MQKAKPKPAKPKKKKPAAKPKQAAPKPVTGSATPPVKAKITDEDVAAGRASLQDLINQNKVGVPAFEQVGAKPGSAESLKKIQTHMGSRV
jgi:hypothetical protein